MMGNFKGTKGRWYAVDYTHFINIQDGDYYEDNNILDSEAVGEIEAKANALLMSKAPEMLEMLEKLADTMREFDGWRDECNQIKQLIKEATTL